MLFTFRIPDRVPDQETGSWLPRCLSIAHESPPISHPPATGRKASPCHHCPCPTGKKAMRRNRLTYKYGVYARRLGMATCGCGAVRCRSVRPTDGRKGADRPGGSPDGSLSPAAPVGATSRSRLPSRLMVLPGCPQGTSAGQQRSEGGGSHSLEFRADALLPGRSAYKAKPRQRSIKKRLKKTKAFSIRSGPLPRHPLPFKSSASSA